MKLNHITEHLTRKLLVVPARTRWHIAFTLMYDPVDQIASKTLTHQ